MGQARDTIPWLLQAGFKSYFVKFFGQVLTFPRISRISKDFKDFDLSEDFLDEILSEGFKDLTFPWISRI